MPRHPTTATAGLLALALALGCAGRGETPPPSAPPSTTAAITPARPTATAQLTLVRGVPASVADRAATLIDVSMGDGATPGSVDASFGDERVLIVAGGCAATAFGAIAMERADPGPAPWARLRWTPAASDVDGSDQTSHVLPVAATLFGGAWRVRAVGIEPQPTGVTRVWVEARSPAYDGGAPRRLDADVAAGGHAEIAIDAWTVLDVALASPDAIGCPALAATLIDPRALVLDVADGQERAVRPGTSLRLDTRVVRFDGMGERRTTTGDRAIFTVTLAPGTPEERAMICSLEAPCVDGDLAVVWVSSDGPHTTLRLMHPP